MKVTLIFMILSMETGSPQYTANIERYETLEQCNIVKNTLLSMEKEEWSLQQSKRSTKWNFPIKQMVARCVEETKQTLEPSKL